MEVKEHEDRMSLLRASTNSICAQHRKKERSEQESLSRIEMEPFRFMKRGIPAFAGMTAVLAVITTRKFMGIQYVTITNRN